MARRVTKTETVEEAEVHEGQVDKTAAYSAVNQVVYLIFGIIELLLFIRFVFRLTGANPAAGIVRSIYSITNVLMVPFRFIFPTAQVEGAVFEWSVLVAMFFYALFAWIIVKIITISYTADTADE